MDLSFLFNFAALPKIALLVLLILGAALIFEFFYFRSHKTPPPPQVTPLPQPPPGEMVVSPPKSKGLPPKTLVLILMTVFVLAAIPTTVFLVGQQQEVRKRASEPAPPPTTCPDDAWLYGEKECRAGKQNLDYGEKIYHHFNDSGSRDFYCEMPNFETSPYWCFDMTGTKIFNLWGGCLDNGTWTLGGITYKSRWNLVCVELVPPSVTPPRLTATPTPSPTPTPTGRPTGTPTPTPTGVPPTATPTPTSVEVTCRQIFVFDEEWQEITSPNSLKVGNKVYFAVSSEPVTAVTKAKFRINSGAWQETTQTKTIDGKKLFRGNLFTIPNSGNFKVEAMVFDGQTWH